MTAGSPNSGGPAAWLNAWRPMTPADAARRSVVDRCQSEADPGVGPRRIAATGARRMIANRRPPLPAPGFLAAGVSGSMSTLFEKE